MNSPTHPPQGNLGDLQFEPPKKHRSPHYQGTILCADRVAPLGKIPIGRIVEKSPFPYPKLPLQAVSENTHSTGASINSKCPGNAMVTPTLHCGVIGRAKHWLMHYQHSLFPGTFPIHVEICQHFQRHTPSLTSQICFKKVLKAFRTVVLSALMCVVKNNDKFNP